ncbi:MAG: hypothetical protein ABJB97_04045 [Acidobacteriota bacterium]
MANDIPPSLFAATPRPISPASSAPAVVLSPRSYKGLAITGWILIVGTCLLSLVPTIGFATWIIAFVVIPPVLVFGIIVLTRGGTAQGIIVIICAVVLTPTFLVLAPVVTTLAFGAKWATEARAQETQIVANLDKIDAAKKRMSGADDTAVTMDDLKRYLSEEIKSVIGETYRPEPIGTAPVAILPKGKSLGAFRGGQEISAASARAIDSIPSSASDTASPSPFYSAHENE